MIWLFFALWILLPTLADAQAGGPFLRPDCTTLTSPTAHATACFDTTIGIWKKWNGERYVGDASGALGLVNPVEFGAVGDGVTTNTTAIQAAFNSTGARSVIFPAGTYLTGTITVPADVTEILCTGGATVKQVALGANLFSVPVTHGLRISGCTLQGQGGVLFASSNAAIKVDSGGPLVIERNLMTGWQWMGARIASTHNVTITNNVIQHSASCLHLIRVSHAVVSSNVCRDPSTPASTFVTGLQLESADTNPGISTDVSIVGNVFANWINAQSILVHAARRLAIVGNTIVNTMMGISINAFVTQDAITDVTVSGNSITGTSASFTATGGAGIQIVGFDATHPAQNVAITGNTVRNMNAVFLDAGTGAIQVHEIEVGTITGNAVYSTFGNGYVLGPNVQSVTLANNLVHAVALASGQAVGIFVNGSNVDAAIRGNRIHSSADGLRFSADNHATLYVTQNHVTAASSSIYANPQNATTDGPVTFNNLGTPMDGIQTFCVDCTFANPCASGGTGAIAKRLAGSWRCD